MMINGKAVSHILQSRCPYLIQCERALPSDCQNDDVSPFVIL